MVKPVEVLEACLQIFHHIHTLAGLCFSPDTLVSSTNKTDCHDITEILLKVVSTPNPNPYTYMYVVGF
jgi:hypothetical protein